jgi:hypothetical protein
MSATPVTTSATAARSSSTERTARQIGDMAPPFR